MDYEKSVQERAKFYLDYFNSESSDQVYYRISYVFNLKIKEPIELKLGNVGVTNDILECDKGGFCTFAYYNPMNRTLRFSPQGIDNYGMERLIKHELGHAIFDQCFYHDNINYNDMGERVAVWCETAI